MNICPAGIDSKKPNFLLKKRSIVNLICRELALKIMNMRGRLGIMNLGEYHDLYLKMDVILLANVFEAFREVCLKNYGLDPAHFFMAPGLAWKACLKKTKIRLELLLNLDML